MTTFSPGHSHGILSSHESQLPITSCTPGEQLAPVTKSQTVCLSTCHMYDVLISQCSNLFWKRSKKGKKMHRLETEMLLPSLVTFHCVTNTQPGGDDNLFRLTVKRAWCIRVNGANSCVSWQTPGKKACNAGTYPLVPESRTPAYRMVSPTCRIFHPQLIKTQKHPQNIPRCLSPRWSETQVLAMKMNRNDNHPRQYYFIKRTGKHVGLQKNFVDLSVEEWHFHTCI